LFSKGEIWLSAPSQLNDPFECRPWFIFDATQDEIIDTLVRHMRRQNPLMTLDTAKAEAVAFYLEGRHRNPAMWEALRKDLLQKLGEEIGLYCLSRVPDSILMWSHYGCRHEGYCLEFEATDYTDIFGEAQPVRYSDSYPIIEAFKMSKEKQAEIIFSTKYTSWAYEQEWRIIDWQNGPGPRKYPPELLRSVIFGLRISESNKALVRKWVGRRGHTVKFFDAVQDDRRFSIELRVVS
jgi:hypothetical protein